MQVVVAVEEKRIADLLAVGTVVAKYVQAVLVSERLCSEQRTATRRRNWPQMESFVAFQLHQRSDLLSMLLVIQPLVEQQSMAGLVAVETASRF